MLDSTTEALRFLERSGLHVDRSSRRRGEYSSDASNYRVVPEAVLFPRHTDEISLIAEACRTFEVPVTARGGGTSVAGNAIGPGLVFDTSRHLNQILELDPKARLARVEPGVVLGDLQAAAHQHGLRFGPDPSTGSRCTLGGMIGNNACGPRALRYGRTSDNVRALTLIDATGRTIDTAALDELPGSLEQLVQSELATLRTEFGRFTRQVSGYSLEHLLPEHGRDLAKALVGTEGTCGLITEATVRLIEPPKDPLLIVLGYPDMVAAARAVVGILPHRPVAIESMDRHLLDAVLAQRAHMRVPEMPTGEMWLFVEIDQADLPDVATGIKALIKDAGTVHSRVVTSSEETRMLWQFRADGVGLAGRTKRGDQAWPGLEDAAVPPEHLADYLAEFQELCGRHGVEGMPYGHFGDGCIHVRLNFPIDHSSDALEHFMHDAARLIGRFGGSLSGEHGDGRARSDLLPYMYSPRALSVMAKFKAQFDPRGLFNPGVLVDPEPVVANLRRPQAISIAARGFALLDDAGDVTRAAHRCVGVGKCRADNGPSGGFMCPSYLATRDEKDSTRGRARILQEAAHGTLIDGLDSPEVAESLDLCLSCKACARDCPAGVDMATLKSEALHQKYRGRLRPITHYTLGWLPRWARLARPIAPLVNAVLKAPGVKQVALRLGGIDPRRDIPLFARSSTRGRARTAQRRREPHRITPHGNSIVLWGDSFTDSFEPSIIDDVHALLTELGFHVITPAPVCCGLTWISTGQLDAAKKRLTTLVAELWPYVEAGVPIVGVEPSCTAVLRSDLQELLPDDPRAERIGAQTRTLAELLRHRPSTRERIDLGGVHVLAQPHCHQHSVMGFEADVELLRLLGATVDTISGCCGLAGNFGMEAGHYDVSVAVAETALLPALRNKDQATVFLADGISCRTQAQQLGATEGLHLGQLLARGLDAHGHTTKAP